MKQNNTFVVSSRIEEHYTFQSVTKLNHVYMTLIIILGRKCKEQNCEPNCFLRHKDDDPTDYSKDTCVAVAIMTHGHSNHIQTIDEEMNITDIINKLIMGDSKESNKEREDLIGKTKWFVMQVPI